MRRVEKNERKRIGRERDRQIERERGTDRGRE